MHADGHAVLTPSPQCTVRLTGCCVFCGSDTLMMSHIHHQGITHGVLIALNTLCPFTARLMSLHPECGFPTCPASAGHGMETPRPPRWALELPGVLLPCGPIRVCRRIVPHLHEPQIIGPSPTEGCPGCFRVLALTGGAAVDLRVNPRICADVSGQPLWVTADPMVTVQSARTTRTGRGALTGGRR